MRAHRKAVTLSKVDRRSDANSERYRPDIKPQSGTQLMALFCVLVRNLTLRFDPILKVATVFATAVFKSLVRT
jgi:hypothetical protein